MTSLGGIPLHAVVSASERPALEEAAALLSRELSAATGSPIAAHCRFLPTMAEIPPAGNVSTVIMSLLPELENLAAPWPEVEQRLRAAYHLAAQRSDLKIFVITVFRYVAAQERGEQTERLRVRIARLNLFAAEISHETGCNVIDIDRVFADIGAQALQTDYRLGGPYAAEAGGANIALTLLSLGLDEYAPYEAQEKARAVIEAQASSWKNRQASPHEMTRRDVMSLGVGRRKQRVSLVVSTVQEKHVSRLLQGVLTRQISLSDASAKLTGAIGQRGWRETSAILFSGVVTLLRDRLGAARPH